MVWLLEFIAEDFGKLVSLDSKFASNGIFNLAKAWVE